jgi:pSer/pThr/pTyr-binding forkhead associated (FHA) protein
MIREGYHTSQSAQAGIKIRETPLTPPTVLHCGSCADDKPPMISRMHATLYLKEGQWYLRDEKTMNGTLLNGRRLETLPQAIADGDIIAFGAPVKTDIHITSSPELEYRFVMPRKRYGHRQ